MNDSIFNGDVMSRQLWWDENKIQQLIFLCSKNSIEAHIKKDILSSSKILINAGRFVDFMSAGPSAMVRANPRICDRWLNLKLDIILNAVDNASYSHEYEEIMLKEINLVIKFFDINNISFNEQVVMNANDEIPELILPEPFDSNEIFY